MTLFWKGKTRIIAKFLRTDLVICSHSREGKNPSYSRINTVSPVYITSNELPHVMKGNGIFPLMTWGVSFDGTWDISFYDMYTGFSEGV